MLYEYQKRFMQEDTKKELILDYLEHYEGNMVCSRQLYAEALANDGSLAHWEIREINDIMNNCSGWKSKNGTMKDKDREFLGVCCRCSLSKRRGASLLGINTKGEQPAHFDGKEKCGRIVYVMI